MTKRSPDKTSKRTWSKSDLELIYQNTVSESTGLFNAVEFANEVSLSRINIDISSVYLHCTEKLFQKIPGRLHLNDSWIIFAKVHKR